MGALGFGQLEPGYGLVYALLIGYFLVIVEIIVGVCALDGGLGAYPKVGCCFEPLLPGQLPQGCAAIVGRVADDLAVPHAITLVQSGVVEAVVHQAMVAGVQAGDEGIMVGEGLARERRDECFCGSTVANKSVKSRRVEARYIVMPEPVKRYKHDIGCLSGLGMGCGNRETANQ